ncbi:MAG TPA: C10 family peptidase, partial [Flavisolibacter sp.]
ISAEFRHEPVCAWIERGRVTSTDSVPGMLAEWFWKKLEDIRFLRDGVYDNTARGYAAWRQLFKETGITLDSAQYRFPDISSDPDCDAQWTVVNKGPLIQTTWGQGCTFNNLCPSMGCVNPQCNAPNAWTGCIATAMAQVVRFWQPVTVYQYDYGSMPLAFGNSEVQRLMRDIGRPESVDMDYQCHGSFADGSRIPGALVGRFGFSSAHRGPYASSSYLSVLQNLDSGWPVILAGCASRQRVWLFFWKYSNCHEWICDGYRELRNPCFSYLWMHMNWGWHEVNGPTDFNGWYLFNNWNIPGVQRNYRYATELTHNIHL